MVQASRIAPHAAMHASPLCHWPESFIGALLQAATYTVGGSDRSAFQSVDRANGPGA
jgi:hypothetical protein